MMRKMILMVCVLLGILTSCGAGEPVTAAYEYRYINMSMTLPADWAYETVSVPEETAGWEEMQGSRYGIAFWPEDAPEMRMGLYLHTDGLGLCGVGVEVEELVMDNGGSARACRYGGDDEDASYYIFFEDSPGEYILSGQIPPELRETYEEALLQIARSVTVGEGNLTESAAIAAADPYTTKEYTHTYADYNSYDGTWKISFAPRAYLTDNEIFQVHADGTVTILQRDEPEA